MQVQNWQHVIQNCAQMPPEEGEKCCHYYHPLTTILALTRLIFFVRLLDQGIGRLYII
jgi:hypothetical protein